MIATQDQISSKIYRKKYKFTNLITTHTPQTRIIFNTENIFLVRFVDILHTFLDCYWEEKNKKYLSFISLSICEAISVLANRVREGLAF